MSGPHDLSDPFLETVIQSVQKMREEFEILNVRLSEAQRNYARLGDDARCPTCSKRGVTQCNCEGGR